MPKKIREMTEAEFRGYVKEKNVVENKLSDNDLNADYDQRDWADQQDFILRSVQLGHPGLNSLSLDQMRDMLGKNTHNTKELWDNVRMYFKASDIRMHSEQLALALFGEYIWKDQKKKKVKSADRVKADSVDAAYSMIDDLCKNAMQGDYINPAQVSFGDAAPVNAGGVVFEDEIPAGLNIPAQKDEWEPTFAYEVVKDPATGLVKFGGVPQPIGTVLTEDIINTGNVDMLTAFREQHRDKLSKREKKYLDTKIKAAQKIRKLETKAEHDMVWGLQADEKPHMDVDNVDGFTGFSKLKLTSPQTSNNGCWSCSYSLLLESRGVDLKQDVIRGYRPDIKENAPKEQKLKKDVGVRLNSDQVSNIFENGDLLMKVLPNTAMAQMVINPMTDQQLVITKDGKTDFMNEEQNKIFKDYFIDRTAKQLQQVITDALTKDKSPVAINWHNHYVTITGINKDGTVRVEDSARSKEDYPTQYLSLKDIVEESVYGKDKDTGYVRATGLGLCWLKDIKPVEYDKRNEEKPQPYPEDNNIVSVDGSGNVKVDIPFDHKCSSFGNPADGQFEGSGINENIKLDQHEVEELLGGKVGNFEPGELIYGSMDTYLPKKVVYLHDPELIKDDFFGKDDRINELRNLLDSSFFSQHAGKGPSLWYEFEDHLTALQTLADRRSSAESVAQAKETLRGLHDLFRKKTEDGITYYQVLEEALELNNRDRFRKLWIGLDRIAGLGLQVQDIVIKGEAERRFDRGEEAMDISPDSGFGRYIFDKRNSLKDHDPETTDKKSYVNDLSKILAAELLWIEDVELVQNNGEKRPQTINRIHEKAEELMRSRAFQNIVAGDKYLTLAEAGNEGRLVNDYLKAKNAIIDAGETETLEGYAFTENDFVKRTDRISDYVRKLRGTRTGSYAGLGIISRNTNSPEYNRALAAAERMTNNGNNIIDADVYMNIQDIKAYLEGKEKVRSTGFGKTRWNCFMAILAESMPRKEFEEYCDHINKVRGVENKPSSSDHVGPENFYPKNTTLGFVLDDTMDRINSGKATKRDYARVLALRNTGLYIEDGQEKFRKQKTNFGRTALRKETDRILRDKDFAAFIDLVDPKTLKNMMEQGPYGIGLMGYSEYLEQKETELARVLNVYENAHPMSAEFILDFVMVRTGRAIRTLLDFADADKIDEKDYQDIHKCLAQNVLQSIMEAEDSRQGAENKPMTAKLKGRADLIDQSAQQIMRSEEFNEALKVMGLDKPNPAKIKAFLLGQKADALAEEFNRQVTIAANKKKAVGADRNSVKKEADKTNKKGTVAAEKTGLKV